MATFNDNLPDLIPAEIDTTPPPPANPRPAPHLAPPPTAAAAPASIATASPPPHQRTTDLLPDLIPAKIDTSPSAPPTPIATATTPPLVPPPSFTQAPTAATIAAAGTPSGLATTTHHRPTVLLPELIPAELADRSPAPNTPPAPAMAGGHPPDLIPAELADAQPAPTAGGPTTATLTFATDDDRRAAAAAWIRQHSPRNNLPPNATEADIRNAFEAERGQVMPDALKGADPAEQAEWTRREHGRYFNTPKPQQGVMEEAGNFAARAADSQGAAIGGAAQLLGRGMQAVGIDSAGQAVQHFGEDFADASHQFQAEHAASPQRSYLDPLSQAAGDTAAVLAGGELGKAAGKAAAPIVGRLVGEVGAEAAAKTAQNVGQRVGLGAVGGVQSAGATKDQLRRQGVDQRVSDLAGAGMGIVGALVSQLFAGNPGAASSLLRRIGTLVAEGGAAGTVQGAAGEAIHSAATGEHYRASEPIKAGAAGAVGAGLTGAATEGLGRLGTMFADLFGNNPKLRAYFVRRAARATTAGEAAAVGEEARQAAEDYAQVKSQQQQGPTQGKADAGAANAGAGAEAAGSEGTNPYEEFKKQQARERQEREQYRRQSEQAKSAPPPSKMDEAAARAELGLDPHAPLYAEDVKAAFRRRVLETHPDAGGSHDAVHRTIEARELLDKRYGKRSRPAPPSQQPSADATGAAASPSTPPAPEPASPAAAAAASLSSPLHPMGDTSARTPGTPGADPVAAGAASRGALSLPAAEPGQHAADYYHSLLTLYPNGHLPDGSPITTRMVLDAVARASGRSAAGSSSTFPPAAAALPAQASPADSLASSSPSPLASPSSSSPPPSPSEPGTASPPAGRPDPRRVFANWLKEPASPAAGIPEQRDLTQVLGHSRPVYHETNSAGAARIIARVQQGPRNHGPIYVSDNQDLALGQGGRGVVLEFDPSYTNGFKPGSVQNRVLGAVAGQGGGGEYVVNKTLKGAVTAFIAKTQRQVAALRKVPGMDRVFDFDNPTQVERGIRIQRKGLTPEQQQQQAQPPAASTAPAPAEGRPGATAAVNAPPTPPAVAAEGDNRTPPPSSPVPVVEPRGQTPANDTAAAADNRNSVMPSRRPVKREARPFTRSDIERQLVAAHQQETVYGEYEDERALSDFHSPFTFLRNPRTRSGLPSEVEHFLEGRAQLRARKVFRVTDNPSQAQGADALAKMGQDRYFQMVDRQTGGRVRSAVEWATDHPDPNLQLLAAIHENMPPARERGPIETIDPSAQPAGTKFRLFGHEFEITEDAEGHRLLKDGDDYPTLPADAVQRMPADKGSVRVEDPEVPDGDVFGNLEPEGQAAAAAGHAPATSDTGIFGQDILRPATGSRQGGLFHEPVEVVGHGGEPIVGASRNALDPRHTAELFGRGGDVGGEEISRTGGNDGGTLSGDGPAAPGQQPEPGRPPAEPASSLRRRDPQAQAGLSVRAGTGQDGAAPGGGDGGDPRQRLGQALRRHAPDGSVVHDTPGGWDVRHPDGTVTPVRVRDLDAAGMDERAFAGALVAQHPGAVLVAPDGRRVTVPDSIDGYNRLSPQDRRVLREGIRIGGQYDRARREIVLPPDADDDAIHEELFHAAFHRLPPEQRRVVTGHFAEPGDSAEDAEERAYRQYRRLPLTPFAGEPDAFEVLRGVRRGETFRQGSGGGVGGGEAEPVDGARLLYNLRNPNAPTANSTLVRRGFVALPDLRALRGELRHLRERFSVIEAKDGPGVARAFIQAVQAGTEANTLYRSFARRAFDSTSDPAKTAADFLAYGYHWRNQLLTAAGKTPTVPALPPAELARIRADPGVQNAVKVWNSEFAPLIDDIRRRNGLPMNPRAATVPLYLNLVGEMGPGEGGHDTAANLSPAFSQPAAGTGRYVKDPEEALVEALRGHLRTDAVNRLAGEIRGLSIPMADVKDPHGTRDPATQLAKPGQPYIGRYKGGWTDVAAVDLNPDPKKGPADVHYVPERVAKAFNKLHRDPDDHDTIFDKALRGATRLGLIGDFAPHSLRVLFQVASRIGQSGQSAATLAPWVGSLPATAKRIHDMIRTPLGDAMQILVDRAGADRGGGYGLHEPGNALTKLLDIPHQLLMHSDYGIDPMARRVVADAYLRTALGNPYMDKVEADLAADRVTAAEAARGIEAALSPADLTALGRRVNATLGFANRQTRSKLLNDLQRFFPFVSSESGMIPDELRKLLTLNLDPAAVGGNVARGQYGRALVQLATILTTGAVGTYLMMQGLNYASTKLWRGKGRWLDENDEGHKLDPELYPGWHVSNFDPTFSRASRMLAVKALANHEIEPHAKAVAGEVAREAANELLSTLNSGLRLAWTGASKLFTRDGQVLHINPDGTIMKAKGGEWYPMGLGRNTVQEGLIQGKPMGPEVAQDAASLLTGLQIKQSSGRNYTPAERLAHEIAIRDAGAGRPQSPEDRAKSQARRQLVDALRQPGAKKDDLLAAARQAGTIAKADYGAVLKESKVSDLQRWVKGMRAEDAADVWDKASPAERDAMRDEVRDKILDARHLAPEQQDALLERTGITPPPELPITRGLHELEPKEREAEAAKKEGISLMRQAGAAERAGDAIGAADLRELGRTKLLAARLAPEDAARLHLLRNLSGAVKRTREQLRDGLIDQAEADSRIRRYVDVATRQPKTAAAGKPADLIPAELAP